MRHVGPSSLVLTACHFTGWDHAGKGDPCIRASGGRLVVNGCEFMDEGKSAVRLEAGLKAASVFGCAFRGPNRVEDLSRRRCAGWAAILAEEGSLPEWPASPSASILACDADVPHCWTSSEDLQARLASLGKNSENAIP